MTNWIDPALLDSGSHHHTVMYKVHGKFALMRHEPFLASLRDLIAQTRGAARRAGHSGR